MFSSKNSMKNIKQWLESLVKKEKVELGITINNNKAFRRKTNE